MIYLVYVLEDEPEPYSTLCTHKEAYEDELMAIERVKELKKIYRKKTQYIDYDEIPLIVKKKTTRSKRVK